MMSFVHHEVFVALYLNSQLELLTWLRELRMAGIVPFGIGTLISRIPLLLSIFIPLRDSWICVRMELSTPLLWWCFHVILIVKADLFYARLCSRDQELVAMWLVDPLFQTYKNYMGQNHHKSVQKRGLLFSVVSKSLN